MEFERRKLEYDSLVSQNTIFIPTCKVCLTIELLKTILCPNRCQIDIQPEKQLIFDKIISELQPNSPEEIFIKQVQSQLNNHQQGVKVEQEVQALKENFNQLKQNFQSIIKEEIQNAIKKVNEQGQTIDLLQYQQKSDKKDFKTETDRLNKEIISIQQKLSEQTDKLARLSMKNDVNLRMKGIEESQKVNKINENLLQQMIIKQEEIQQKQDSFIDQITELKNQQQELKKQYLEAKKVALHSSNLVTAADSVFSAHQEMKNFEKRTSYTLEELKTQIDNLKKQFDQTNFNAQEKGQINFQTIDIENIMEQQKNEIQSLQSQSRESKGINQKGLLSHPGKLE